MTLSPAQWEKIYAGISKSLNGVALTVMRARQFVNLPTFPIVLVSPVTEGIPVTEARQLWERYNEEDGMMDVARGQSCRARISAVIEAVGLTEARALASAFSQDLFTRELAINPIQDRMQFRGADPPEVLAPYQIPNKAYVQRYNIDFFVEYEFSWITKVPVIREVVVELNEDAPVRLSPFRIQNVPTYSLDVIIER